MVIVPTFGRWAVVLALAGALLVVVEALSFGSGHVDSSHVSQVAPGDSPHLIQRFLFIKVQELHVLQVEGRHQVFSAVPTWGVLWKGMHCQDWVKLHGIRMGRNCCVRSKFWDCGKSIIWYTNSSTARAGCGFRGNIKDTFSTEENVIKHANIKS